MMIDDEEMDMKNLRRSHVLGRIHTCSCSLRTMRARACVCVCVCVETPRTKSKEEEWMTPFVLSLHAQLPPTVTIVELHIYL